MFVCSCVRVLGCSDVTLSSFSWLWPVFTLYKRIVNIMKVYIERKNIQVRLLPFRKNIDFIDFGNLEVRNMRVYEIGFIAIRDVSPPF